MEAPPCLRPPQSDLAERQIERLKAVEARLANGAHYADDDECDPLYLQAVAARQILTSKMTRLRTQRDDAYGALRSLAEGNLGDLPWQANYQTVKLVASMAIPPEHRAVASALLASTSATCTRM